MQIEVYVLIQREHYSSDVVDVFASDTSADKEMKRLKKQHEHHGGPPWFSIKPMIVKQ